MSDTIVKEKLVYFARRAYNRGLVGGTGGNFSGRISENRLAITASGMNLGDTSLENLIEMSIDTYEWQSGGDYVPSSEYLFHADILRLRPDIDAVMHVHPPHATAFAVLKRDIPMVTDSAFKQPHIPRVPFAPSGTRELQENVVTTLQSNPGCKVLLLEQHGIICLGPDIRQAYDLGDLIEELARIAYLKETLG